MAFNPISNTAIRYLKANGNIAAGYYLKFYTANTTTAHSMATDAGGLTLLVKCKLNSVGYPISNPLDNNTEFVPHVDESYRFVLYVNEADADANNTANADTNIPSLTVADLTGNTANIATNTANIATNVTNIATNTAQLAINTPQIAANKAQSEANKVSCTASFSSSVYTVTYDIEPTIWPTLEAGLIIDFPLSVTANTGAVSINFNGTTDSLRWLDGSLILAGELDGDKTKRLVPRFDGTNWVIISDVAGSDGSVNWIRAANGNVIFDTRVTANHTLTTGTGALFYNNVILLAPSFPFTLASVPSTSVWVGASAISWTAKVNGTNPTTTTDWSGVYLLSSASLSSSSYTIEYVAHGRWY